MHPLHYSNKVVPLLLIYNCYIDTLYYELILMVYAFTSSSSNPIVVNHNICTLFRIFIIIFIYVILLVHH